METALVIGTCLRKLLNCPDNNNLTMHKSKAFDPTHRTLGAENVVIIGELNRFQTKKTAKLSSIARRFPGNNLETIKEIAEYVFQKTHVEESATLNKLSRHAEKVLDRGAVDLLHCFDRCHALLGILNAKGVPSWLVMSVDLQNFAHTYVETLVGKKLYTVAFRTYKPPLVCEGKTEKAVEHPSTSVFLRGNDLGNLGVRSRDDLKHLIDRINAGKAKGTIQVR